MKTEITNKRTVIDITSGSDEHALALRGSAIFSQEHDLQSFYGNFYSMEEEEEHLGSFNYSCAQERISQSLDIATDYEEDAEALMSGVLREIRTQKD